MGPTTPVTAGTAGAVTVVVANTGEQSGTYSAVLKVNSVDYKTQDVTLNAGESKSVVFQVTEPKAGNYALAAGTATGTLTVTPLPMSVASLNLADVGSGYIPISAQDMDMDLNSFTADVGLPASDWFGFANAGSPDTFSFIFGFKAYPLTVVQQLATDLEIGTAQINPKTFVGDFESGFGSQLTRYEILPSLNSIGDKSIGLRLYMNESGVNLALDFVYYRIGDTVTFLFVMWMPDTAYKPTTDTLARLLESREKQVIASK